MDEETIRLADGGTIHVREVRPEDRHLFREGEQRLSSWTWRARFLMPRDHLEPAELDYLTHPDGERHVALGAVTRDADGVEGPVGVARYLLIPDEEAVAECAILVVDDHQGRGVGRLLAERLLAAARERGVKEFRCEVLPDNEPMKHLIEDLAPETVSHLVGSILHMRVPVGEDDAS